MNSRKRTLLLIPLALATSLSGLASAGGSVSGTVTDPSSAAMPGVMVLVRNVDTGVVQRTATNESGYYAFPELPGGHYALDVEHPNFKPFIRTGLEVTSSAVLRVDIELIWGRTRRP